MNSKSKITIGILVIALLSILNIAVANDITRQETNYGESTLIQLQDLIDGLEVPACVDTEAPVNMFKRGADQFCVNPGTGKMCGIQNLCIPDDEGACQETTCQDGMIVIGD